MKKFVFLLVLISTTLSLGDAELTTQLPSEDMGDCPEKVQKTTEESNKELVLEFYQKVFGDLDFEAIDDPKYLRDPYIQHNPQVADGKEGLRAAVKNWLKDAQKRKLDIKRVGADGDLVWVHQKMNLQGHDLSVMDIFRVEKGNIVEHWDVIQAVPEKSLNNNTMF